MKILKPYRPEEGTVFQSIEGQVLLCLIRRHPPDSLSLVMFIQFRKYKSWSWKIRINQQFK